MLNEYSGLGHEEFIKTYLNNNFIFEEEAPEVLDKEFLGDYDYFKYDEEE